MAESVRRHNRRLKVLLADDHQLILDGVRHALEDAGDEFEVVGEATKGSQVLPLVNRTAPDVVMLDLRMPELDGLVCLDQIKRRHPETKVIVLSVSSDRSLIDNVLKRGASAYIVKSVNPVDLPAVIRQAVEETVYTAIGLPDDPSSRAAKAAGLTERELAILTALARGMSNAAIAKHLWVAQQTVKFHLTNIYRKLGVANRTEAARYAYQQGLIESPLTEGDESQLG
jgi:NarL family two-component system response regulator LiaR